MKAVLFNLSFEARGEKKKNSTRNEQSILQKHFIIDSIDSLQKKKKLLDQYVGTQMILIHNAINLKC